MKAFSVSLTIQTENPLFTQVVGDYRRLWFPASRRPALTWLGIPTTDPPGRQVPGDSKAPPRGSLWKIDVPKVKSKRAA